MSRGLAARLRAGETTVGSFAGLGSPVAVEVLAVAGLDWILLDLEHGGGGEEQLGPARTAARAHGAELLVRVERPERIRIGRVLDAGAAGVMLPRVDSAAEVEAILRHLRYPPRGDRGVATYNRAVSWGLDRPALSRDEELLAIVQIETLGALEEIEEIVRIPGVDVVFIGPLDLGYALGVPLDVTAPAFRAAVERVLAAAREADCQAGILAPDVESAAARIAEGFGFVAVGSDSTLLAQAAQAAAALIPAPEDGGTPR